MSARRWSLMVAAAAAMVGMSASAVLAAEPKRGGTVTAVYSVETNTLFSPAGGGGNPLFAATKMMERLLGMKLDNSFTPQLATSWAVSPDGKTYTFKLRPGVLWHDGKPFTSADVAFTAQKVWKDLGNDPVLQAYDRIETPDPQTFVMHYTNSTPLFMVMAAMAGGNGLIAPKHIYDGTDLNTNPANNAPIGTGAYKFKEWVRGSHVELVRNDNYWDKPYPYLDKLIIRYIQDRGARAAAMEAGEVQVGVSDPLARPDLKRLGALPQFTVTDTGSLGEVMIVEMNVNHPALSNKKVRQAIAHALDKKIVTDNFMLGLGAVADSPVAPWQKYFNKEVPRYEFDVRKAARMLDEAGFPVKDGKRFDIKVVATPWYDENPRMGGYIKQQLEQLGVKVTLETPDRSAAIKQIYTDRAFDLSISNNASYADPMMRTSLLYTSDNVGKVFRNAAGYKNPEVDSLLQKALFEANEEARTRVLNEFQRIVMEDVPVLPIAWKGNVTIFNKKIQNVTARPEVQYDSWKDMWIE